MLEVIPYDPSHLLAMRIQPHQIGIAQSLAEDAGLAETLNCPDLSYSIQLDGETLFSGGALPHHPGACTIWAVLSYNWTKYALPITRRCLDFLDHLQLTKGYARVQLTTEEDFPQAARWAKMLGFEYEGLMPKFGQDGQAHLMYGRIR